MGKVVIKTGAKVWARGMLHKSSMQSVLLYGSDSWVVMGSMLKLLEVFHHWVERIIVGMTVCCTMSIDWGWTPVAEALDTAGIWPIK